MSSIFINEFHQLLYVLSAALLFFIILPKVPVTSTKRKLLLLCILGGFSTFYYGLETIDPLIYALHLTPLAIMLASMFEGAVAGAATWSAFVVCGIAFMGVDFIAILVSNTLLFALGLVFHYRLYRNSLFVRILLIALLLVGIHMGTYIAIVTIQGAETDFKTLAAITVGTFLSAALMVSTCYRARNLEAFNEEQYNAEKYKLIGQLAASISHEVRNPLTMTSGFLQMMGKQSLEAATLERYRQHAIEGIDHATSIIRDYLNYAKPAVEEARAIDVKAEIEALIPWISSLDVMSNIDIRIHHLERESIFFMGEPKKFQQCLLNIIKNAIEAMPSGGRLTITTMECYNQVRITIADTGIGMSKLQLKRIGTPFFTTKEKGTGLGLMVVVSLIHVMGGQIGFRSKPGEGTMCDIRYPLYKH